MGKGARKKIPQVKRSNIVLKTLPDPPVTRSQAALLKLFKDYATNPGLLRDPRLRRAVEGEILRTPRVITRRQINFNGYRDEDDMEELAKKLKYKIKKGESIESGSNAAVFRGPASNAVRRRNQSICSQRRNQSVNTSRRKNCDLKRNKNNSNEHLVLIRGMEPKSPSEYCLLNEKGTTSDEISLDRRVQTLTDGDRMNNIISSGQAETILGCDRQEFQAVAKETCNNLHQSRDDLFVTNWIDNAMASVTSYFTGITTL